MQINLLRYVTTTDVRRRSSMNNDVEADKRREERSQRSLIAEREKKEHKNMVKLIFCKKQHKQCCDSLTRHENVVSLFSGDRLKCKENNVITLELSDVWVFVDCSAMFSVMVTLGDRTLPSNIVDNMKSH
ncbi:CLUMA_CG019681, isoform A [Clunio marinus]|uniref:CLUMA_CG019681, isoform A n=1 Tax=Clunio marinus TaxID=568069 RepID=A0A1J1J2U8_9DIPT|nr:CLUMA_CG019681, isoform A [Clunio marinus]